MAFATEQKGNLIALFTEDFDLLILKAERPTVAAALPCTAPLTEETVHRRRQLVTDSDRRLGFSAQRSHERLAVSDVPTNYGRHTGPNRPIDA